MHILLVTDQYRGSDHSAIEAVFGRYLSRSAKVTRVYFDRDVAKAECAGEGILILPYRYRRKGLATALSSIIELSAFDVVVVRNLFPALRGILAGRTRHHYRVAFWDSFPHAYRRRFEAELTGRGRRRKALEYLWRHRAERHLLEACDAYLPITGTHCEQFFPDLRVPIHPLPMGFDFETYPDAEARPARGGPICFIYTGTIDRLRRMDTVLAGFARVTDDFKLHLYTPAPQATLQTLRLPRDPRFIFHNSVSRPELIRQIAASDVGVSLIPPEKLYLGSSPTKTLEYYAAGLPALLSQLPDHRALFDADTAFLTPFNVNGIAHAVEQAARCSRAQLDAMGRRGRNRVREQRNYAHMASDLLAFLAHLPSR